MLISVTILALIASVTGLGELCAPLPRCRQSYSPSCARFSAGSYSWGYEMEWWGREAEDAARRLQERLGSIRGQDHAIPQIMNAVLGKMHDPSSPLVLQFSGDNGVGKSYTAEQISLALSLRCGNDCSKGDNMLIIGGTAYKGLELGEARKMIFARIREHAQLFPHGIILVNDIQSMDPELVVALTPLFGR